jgi:hypothetical protein
MKLSVRYGTEMIPFTVQFRKRKTLEIQVKPPGHVHVVAPVGTREETIRQVVEKKGAWIVRKLAGVRERESKKMVHHFVAGELFLFLGRHYMLQLVEAPLLKKPTVTLAKDQLIIQTPLSEASILRQALEKWYRQKGQEIITERVQAYSHYFDVRPASIKVKEQKKRWGSCTSRGDLLFNWRIVMAPLSVIDYVVVHEMCHMVHMNHSPQFWDLVAAVLPDYKQRKAWLKTNGVLLDI